MGDKCSPCSVVLEGGVTSAVIYASLLARLSRDYTFRDLGGASSGAVAAAAAAAAEFARCNSAGQSTASFTILGAFPALLAGDPGAKQTMLFKLFQPQRKGRASFNVAMAALDRKGDGSLGAAVARVFVALAANFRGPALLAALAVGGTGWLVADWLSSKPGCGAGIESGLLCAAGFFVVILTAVAAGFALVVWALWVTVRALRENHWGLCSGMNGDDPGALTLTLHNFFQQLSGLGSRAPLTFGDLWWGPTPQDGSERHKPAKRQIDLQVITTAVNLARPVRLPGKPGDDPLLAYFYDPQEWAKLFPSDIMLHLKAHARGATLKHDDGRLLTALPKPEQWPVLVAARFSLSFPLLLSALPMYIAVPRREMLRAGAEAKQLHFEARKVYFSDGGITSNCPVHLFDAPLPGFPTFGVNLYELPPHGGIRISRSDKHDPELEAAATADAATWKSPVPFLWTIVSTMLDWRDNLQRSLPGYRERIVHIGLSPDEGGLNLAMTRTTILKLGKHGVEAADRLCHDFLTPRSTGEATAWERHRWTRARTTLSALHAYLAAFVGGSASGEPDYTRELRTATPLQHPFQDETARRQALDLVEGTRALMQEIDSTVPADALEQNTPRPAPVLHMSPPW